MIVIRPHSLRLRNDGVHRIYLARVYVRSDIPTYMYMITMTACVRAGALSLYLHLFVCPRPGSFHNVPIICLGNLNRKYIMIIDCVVRTNSIMFRMDLL